MAIPTTTSARATDSARNTSSGPSIGSAVARIVDVLLHDQRAILSICSRISGVPDCEGLTLALPHLVGGEGAMATIPLSLDGTEREALCRSAGILREAIQSLKG